MCPQGCCLSWLRGFQSIFFGLLLLSVAGSAIPWAGCHCLVLPVSPRDQPGHQICVRSPCEEEHRGQNCGDPRWRGGKSSFVSPTLHPYLPTGCPQGTCTIPEPHKQPRQGASDPSEYGMICPGSWRSSGWQLLAKTVQSLSPRSFRAPAGSGGGRTRSRPSAPPPGAEGVQAGAQGGAVGRGSRSSRSSAGPTGPGTGHGRDRGHLPPVPPSPLPRAPCPGAGAIPAGAGSQQSARRTGQHRGSPAAPSSPPGCCHIPAARGFGGPSCLILGLQGHSLSCFDPRAPSGSTMVPRASPRIHSVVWETPLYVPSAPRP